MIIKLAPCECGFPGCIFVRVIRDDDLRVEYLMDNSVEDMKRGYTTLVATEVLRELSGMVKRGEV